MTKLNISPAVLEAGAKADYERWVYHATHVDGSPVGDAADYRTWEQLDDDERSEALDRTRAAFEAMVAAWQGAKTEARYAMSFEMGKDGPFVSEKMVTTLILPMGNTDGNN